MYIHRSLELLWPPFADLVIELTNAMYQSKWTIVVLESYRSPIRQNALFAKGRVRPGKIITNSRAWQSYHQYGLAVDFVFDCSATKKGIQGPYKGDFELLGRHAKDLRLDWGGRWGDKGHIQYTGGMTIDQAKLLNAREGLLGLWSEMKRP